MLRYLLKHPVKDRSVEYNDNRFLVNMVDALSPKNHWRNGKFIVTTKSREPLAVGMNMQIWS